MLALQRIHAPAQRKARRLPMSTTLTIRNLSPELKDRLRMAAATHGRSMEEEVRTILRQALAHTPAQAGLGSRIHARFAALGGVELEPPPRTERARAAEFTPAAAVPRRSSSKSRSRP
jgi:plasmid stability protein